MNWKWWLSPARPRSRYSLYTAFVAGVLMLISSPIWLHFDVIGAGVAGGISAGLAGVLVKVWMERRQGREKTLRIWHGWTLPENADGYEKLLKTEIFPAIADKRIRGYCSIELLRRDLGDEVEFITMTRFDSRQSAKDVQSANFEAAYVPETAQALLKRFDERSKDYELREAQAFEYTYFGERD